jgi:deazaflavin-dependent oxidoreductase (nitroreductase family)
MKYHWWERLLIALAATPFGGWLVLYVLTTLDTPIMRLSKGRYCLSSILTGIPTLLLTTQGAKSGQPRSVPLLVVKDGSDLIVIASATGIDHNPAWYYNLKAHPQVEILMDGQVRKVTAREVEGEERQRLWQKAVEVYWPYRVYEQRASHRRIPVMVLSEG